jgi:hypothetical protein
VITVALLLLYTLPFIVTPVFRIILKVFISRSIEELYELRDGRFELTIGGQGSLIGSTVNGSSFTFGIGTSLSALDVQTFAQTAIEYKEAGICAPVTRTTARFV